MLAWWVGDDAGRMKLSSFSFCTVILRRFRSPVLLKFLSGIPEFS